MGTGRKSFKNKENDENFRNVIKLPPPNVTYSINLIFLTGIQAWRGRKRQVRGHHSPPSIQGEWLIIDDQKNNILASLCRASYLVANWLQKLETKHCLLRRSYFCSYVCVVSQFDLSITK